jgi:hypothetical protein
MVKSFLMNYELGENDKVAVLLDNCTIDLRLKKSLWGMPLSNCICSWFFLFFVFNYKHIQIY